MSSSFSLFYLSLLSSSHGNEADGPERGEPERVPEQHGEPEAGEVVPDSLVTCSADSTAAPPALAASMPRLSMHMSGAKKPKTTRVAVGTH
jgi:hypothetical protein